MTMHRTQITNALTPLLSGATSFALFDFPNHCNVGDSLIWLGLRNYLRDTHPHSPVVHVEEHPGKALPPLPDLPSGCVILICGGGNFGDLYPLHQALRHQLVCRYPAHRIVQLPQSIHFESTEAARQSGQRLASHPDFHLMVRDHDSFRQAQAWIPPERLHLCPDMALYLETLGVARPLDDRPKRIVCLMRQDKERSNPNASLLPPSRSSCDLKRPGVRGGRLV